METTRRVPPSGPGNQRDAATLIIFRNCRFSKGASVYFDYFASTPARQHRLSSHVWLSVIALGLAILLCPSGKAQDDVPHTGSDVPPILKIGSHAPDFNLPGVDGKSHSLNDYAS